MTKEQAKAERNDREWISHPEWWDEDYLPLKNKTEKDFGLPQTGVIVATKPLEVRVGILGLTDWAKAECRVFSTLDEMLAAGWQVD